MQHLQWAKSIDGKWFNLAKLDLTYIQCNGVYIIWHGGANPRIVRVGHGDIAERLRVHRSNMQITRYGNYGPLLTTWATVADVQHCEGIASYLAMAFKPLVRDRSAEATPIVARMPFG